jgi:hypothetical protein
MWNANGFAADSLDILKRLRDGGANANHTVLCFAATCSDKPRSFIQRLLGAHANHVCVRGSEAPPPPTQLRLECSVEGAKTAALLRLVAQAPGQTLVFARLRSAAKQLRLAGLRHAGRDDGDDAEVAHRGG